MIPSFVARLSIINTLGEVLGNYLNCDLYLVKTCFESGDRLHKFEETKGRASLAEVGEAGRKQTEEIFSDLSHLFSD